MEQPKNINNPEFNKEISQGFPLSFYENNSEKRTEEEKSKVDKREKMRERIEEIKKKVEENINSNILEANTKQWLIIPFIQMLGFNVYSSEDFQCEYPAEYKRFNSTDGGKKVDFALKINNELIAIIEAKPLNEHLDGHIKQLTGYYGTIKTNSIQQTNQSAASFKYGILTNGRHYWFFEDSNSQNIMDAEAFFMIDLLNITDTDIDFLLCFQKCNFIKNKTSNVENVELYNLKLEVKLKCYIDKNIRGYSNDMIDRFLKQIRRDVGVNKRDMEDGFERKIERRVFSAFCEYFKNCCALNECNIINKDNLDDKNNECDLKKPTNEQEKKVEFQFLGSVISGKSWRAVQLNICEKVIKEFINSEDIFESFSRKCNRKKRQPFLKDVSSVPFNIRERYSKMLSNGFYVYNHLSAKDMRKFFRKLEEFIAQNYLKDRKVN